MTPILLIKVTPFVGVWIETATALQKYKEIQVTPFVGVWIETYRLFYISSATRVTPFVGVWIETLNPIGFKGPK